MLLQGKQELKEFGTMCFKFRNINKQSSKFHKTIGIVFVSSKVEEKLFLTKTKEIYLFSMVKTGIVFYAVI